MLELVGWKRLEMNKLIRFAGVTDANFGSIIRRSFVWKPKALFVDAGWLAEHYPDATLDGVFPADAALKRFLISGPAVAAAIRVQHGFEVLHSREARARGRFVFRWVGL